jgi:hypothetical protein
MRSAHDWGRALGRPRRYAVASGRSSRQHLALALVGLAAVAACSESSTAPGVADNTSEQTAIARESNLITANGIQYPLVGLTPNQSSMTVGAHVNFQARLTGGDGSHWMGRYITWKSSNDAVVSITTANWGNRAGDNGDAIAHKNGTATITATTQSHTVGAITITVGGSGSGGGGGGGTTSSPPPSSVGGSGGQHEPSGMYAQINTGAIRSTGVVSVFSPSSTSSTGESSGNLSIVSGGTGLRMTYRTNLTGGYSPVRFGVAIPSAGTGWYYQRMKVRFSSNWTLNGNVGLKFCEPRTWQQGSVSGGNENHVISMSDFLTNSRHAFLNGFLQGPYGQARNLFEQPLYSSAADLNDGQWHTVEILFAPESSPGSGNGQYTAWVDGTQIARYTNVQFLASGNRSGWPYLMFDPTYGGGNHSPSSTMYWDMDDLYVSTR